MAQDDYPPSREDQPPDRSIHTRSRIARALNAAQAVFGGLAIIATITKHEALAEGARACAVTCQVAALVVESRG